MSKKNKTKTSLLEQMEVEGFGHCYICLELAGRIRFTNRYCNHCEGYFCYEHGSFRGNRIAYCIMHDSKLNKIADEKLNSK